MTPIVIIGGHHDGLTGRVRDECVRLGFLVQKSIDDDGVEWWHGYHANGERDAFGRLIFRPRRRAA